MRRLWITILAAVSSIPASGCMINQYSSDPRTRADQLMNQSEDLRQIVGSWRRFWFNDMPSHLTPERLDGGIMK